MELNVWRPSNGVWYCGRSFTGTGGFAYAFGTYGDIPFAPDIDGNGDGDHRSCFRPSTGTWYGYDSEFLHYLGTAGGYPGPPFGPDRHQASALTVYRPTTGLTYNCFSPHGFIVHGRDEHRGSIRLAWRRPPSGQMEVAGTR